MSRLLRHVFKLALFLAAITLLASCASNQKRVGTLDKGDKDNPWVMLITWKTDACKVDTVLPVTKSTCDSSRPKEYFCVDHGEHVEWQGGIDKKYRIYFSPFTRRSAHAGTSDEGRTKMRINTKAPPGLYKYAILADGCDPETDTFDPHIRVGR